MSILTKIFSKFIYNIYQKQVPNALKLKQNSITNVFYQVREKKKNKKSNLLFKERLSEGGFAWGRDGAFLSSAFLRHQRKRLQLKHH